MARISVYRVVILGGLTMLFAANVAGKNNPAVGVSGRDIYMDRCSACHGEDGKGNGPAVGALKIAPGDLTLLAQRNGGAFPAERVKNIVGGLVDIRAHGSREMPIWGELFHPKNASEQQAADARFKAMVAYLESIQQ